MLKNFLTKEEQKLFSNKGWAKVKQEDFFAYLEMEQAVLDSLLESTKKSNVTNPIVVENIAKQEKYVEILHKYYYETILPEANNTEESDMFAEELAKELKVYKKIQKEVKIKDDKTS